ncbi:MAG: hypothetical protein CFH19_00177 [Alphaproteobacteria bacterium MarineAlpha5_Bin9]|nr:MAG: hypothetical protein CFH19_00177 [Alphaproteobacteria bacterium MarineAlpha5_Bin9]
MIHYFSLVINDKSNKITILIKPQKIAPKNTLDKIIKKICIL